MTEDSGDAGLPPDPFEPEVPEFESFSGPYADEIRALLRRYASAKSDFKALVTQPSFRELGLAVAALDEERARDALLAALAVCYAHHVRDEERFARWVESQ